MTLSAISLHLEQELRREVLRNGTVVWLDRDGHYKGLVDELVELSREGTLPYDVLAFRGSYLQLMLELEPHLGGLEKPHMLLHLPGFNEERVRDTPLYELYACGVRFRKALDTLITEAAVGHVSPQRTQEFLAERSAEPSGLTLARAEQWLTEQLNLSTTGLAGQLSALAPTALIDDLLGGGVIAQQLKTSSLDPLWDYAASKTGMPAQWPQWLSPDGSRDPNDLAFVSASWVLCVEYVDDLSRSPVKSELKGIPALPAPLRKGCSEIAEVLRSQRPPFYRQVALETENWLAEEIDAARAEELGRIDTFRFEEHVMLKAALEALSKREWARAGEFAAQRLESGNFWLRDTQERDSGERLGAWQLIGLASELGAAIGAAGMSLRANSLEEAATRYQAAGAAVDLAHRRLEQRRAALLWLNLAEVEPLRAAMQDLRNLWRQWADQWAREFSALCLQHGFLPPSSLRQRTLFDQVIRPLTQESGTSALFVVDALRYEMALELGRAIETTAKSSCQLHARFAELPTITAVGMNALAPVADGDNLVPILAGDQFKGFSTGQYQVTNPKTRQRAMHERVGGDTSPWLDLDDLLNKSDKDLRRAVARAKLVVVHDQQIDVAGERGFGPRIFDDALRRLKAGWLKLRDAGIKRFVITADHGFLLLDDQVPQVQSHGRRIDPKRRHVVSPVAADHRHEVRVPLVALGYENVDGQLMFPDSTAVFDTAQSTQSFVHGGNSLQERLIPVLTILNRGPSGAHVEAYRVVVTSEGNVASMHWINVRVDVLQETLGFSGAKELELMLATEIPGVNVEVVQIRGAATVESGTIVAQVGRSFDVFFRLWGDEEQHVRVKLHHCAPTPAFDPVLVDSRFFLVSAVKPADLSPADAASADKPVADDWLSSLPEGGIRQLFAHLAGHGSITEVEAARMLGGPRQLRRFSQSFEDYAAKVPFRVRIDVVAGMKRYVKEG